MSVSKVDLSVFTTREDDVLLLYHQLSGKCDSWANMDEDFFNMYFFADVKPQHIGLFRNQHDDRKIIKEYMTL